MKKAYILIIVFVISLQLKSQNYLHPTTGIAGEYVGACETATCGGNYYDNGGPAGNYSTFIGYPAVGGIYRIFCPDAIGMCMRATFSSFSIEGGAGCPYDIFTVTNGSTQNSPMLFNGCGTGAIGPFQGTINGCLGFRFRSDNTVTFPGWAAVLSCVACAGGPNGTDNNDCVRATPLCASTSVPGNSTGPGIVAEACGGAAGCPAGGENYSNWFTVQFTTGGTFLFTIVPSIASDDYDYAVYGPNLTCSTLGNALRCSDAALTGNTGLSAAAADLTENVSGDKFTAQMNVLAGETYYLMIDEWTPTGAGYSLNFGGTAVMSCAILPVELLNFTAVYNLALKQTDLKWVTSMESNVDYYSIQRSSDAADFKEISRVLPSPGGNSNQMKDHEGVDKQPLTNEINYYRIVTIDKNGQETISSIQAVAFEDINTNLSLVPNPANNQVDLVFKSPKGKNWGVTLYDSKGNLLQTIGYDALNEGVNNISVNLNELSRGMYFINVSDGTNFYKRKLIRE